MGTARRVRRADRQHADHVPHRRRRPQARSSTGCSGRTPTRRSSSTSSRCGARAPNRPCRSGSTSGCSSRGWPGSSPSAARSPRSGRPSPCRCCTRITFSMHIAVVDQVVFGGAGTPRSILLDDAALDRAARLGANVAAQLGRPFDEARVPRRAGPVPDVPPRRGRRCAERTSPARPAAAAVSWKPDLSVGWTDLDVVGDLDGREARPRPRDPGDRGRARRAAGRDRRAGRDSASSPRSCGRDRPAGRASRPSAGHPHARAPVVVAAARRRARQVAYRIRTDNGWDTGRVDSDRSLLVPYEGPPLGSAERVTWQVHVWTDTAARATGSAPALVRDWAARWIQPPGTRAAAGSGRRTCCVLFTLDGPGRPGSTSPRTASTRRSSTGSGRRRGTDARLHAVRQPPAGADLRHQRAGAAGENVLAIVLSDGWFRGRPARCARPTSGGPRVALLAQRDRSRHRALACGERTDRRRPHRRRTDGSRSAPARWASPGFDDAAWTGAIEGRPRFDILTDSPAPPVRRVEEIEPVAVTRPAPGRQVVDLGQQHQRLGAAGAPRAGRHPRSC